MTLRIHGPRGVTELASEAASPRGERGDADQVLVTEIMATQVVCASADLGLRALIELMIRDHLGCVPIVNELAQPIGMVTKFDIVEQFSNPTGALISDVMMPMAITLEDHATVAHAAALMASEDMHHVLIVSARRLVGVVSTMDVTRWLARREGLLR